MQALGKGLLIIAPWLMKSIIDCRRAGDVPHQQRDCGTWYCRRCITPLNISPGSKVQWWR
ncbi:hypothetical protein ACNKHL_11860 [Shigella flexneri]